MANGIAIKDVDNKLQSLEGDEIIPISTGANEPEVVEVDTLKEYITEDIDTALEGKQDVINDLATIRSGAALGATALQSESDPTVHEWAKAEQKPSYTASEVGAVPTTRKINNKALSSDITLTAADVNALPSSTVIPAAQIQSDWNQSNTSAKDYIKNKPEIPVLPTLADVATSGDYEDLTNTPTIPDVPEWAMSSTKPSYTVSEIDGAQEELVSGTNIKTINNESILGSGNITIQGGGGDVNVIESITFNGSAVPVDSSKNAAITYSAPVTSVNGNTGAVTISVPTKVSDLTNDSGFITSYTETDPVFSASVAASITSADITAWNGKSTFSGSYNDLTDKPTLFSGAYADLTGKPNLATVATSGDYDDLSNKPTIPTVPTALSSFTDDLGNSPTHTHSQYLTSAPVTSVNGQTGAVSLSIPTVPSNVSAFTNDAGYTTNTGTVTSVTVNGSTYSPTSGDVNLGTVITSHQDISGKENTSNKVTSLSASSTDTEYPSAKCVWDLIGDIETILASI